MSLQSILFSEGLAAVTETATTVLLMTFMHCYMVAKSSARGEAFGTVLPSALVISDFGVCALYVVLKVSGAQVGFGTSLICAFVRSGVCVRSEMVL